MTVNIPCRRCGTQIHLVGRPDGAQLNVHVLPHTCYRVLIAECWQNGEIIACWNSNNPGRTGPETLVYEHAKDADEGWEPPAGNGWTYRWQIDEDSLRASQGDTN